MPADDPRLTVDELFELLKRTSLPTVLVEGKDDIIFYREIERDLQGLDVDMLPAGNKGAVLELRKRLEKVALPVPVVFVVDNDLWVHSLPDDDLGGVIRTSGYSIENDIFSDGEIFRLLSAEEVVAFQLELTKFVRWYALAVGRHLEGKASTFRTHPGKILDDQDFYLREIAVWEDEKYPLDLFNQILDGYDRMLRGKSLFALIVRQLSAKKREVKFGVKQLMSIGAARRGRHFQRIRDEVRASIQG